MSESGIRSKVTSLLLTVLAGFLGGVLLHEPFTRFTCGLMSPGFAADMRFYCDDQHRPVSVEDATVQIDKFLERASGVSPGSAWAELPPDEQESRPREEFLEAWSDVLWAERIGPVAPVEGEFNRFTTRHRTFKGTSELADRRVVSHVREFQVKYLEGDAYIADLDSPEPKQSSTPVIPNVGTVPQTASHPLPTTAVERRGTAGRTVLILCRIAMPDGIWGRHPLGWVQARNIVGGAGAIEGVTECDPAHGEAALALAGE